MTNGVMARQALVQVAATECVADVAHVPFGMKPLPVETGDAAGFLTAMLQGVQAERGKARGFRHIKYAKNSTFQPRRVVVGVARLLGPVLVRQGHRERSGASGSAGCCAS